MDNSPSHQPQSLPTPPAQETKDSAVATGLAIRTRQFSTAAIIIISLLGVIIAGGVFVAYKQGVFMKPDPIAEAAKIPIYKGTLEETLLQMAVYASHVEDVCQGHVEMWRSAAGESQSSIDSTMSSSMDIHAESILFLKEGKTTVASNMRKLQNPPPEYEAVYDRLVTLFGQFNSFSGLAISPSGSLRTYIQSCSHLLEDLVRGLHEIEVMIPE